MNNTLQRFRLRALRHFRHRALRRFRRRADMHWAIYGVLCIMTVGAYAFYFSYKINQLISDMAKENKHALADPNALTRLHFYLAVCTIGGIVAFSLSVLQLSHPHLKSDSTYKYYLDISQDIWLAGGYAWAYKARAVLRNYFATQEGVNFQPNGVLMLFFPNMALLCALRYEGEKLTDGADDGHGLSKHLNMHWGIYIPLVFLTGGVYCLVGAVEIISGLVARLNTDPSKMVKMKWYFWVIVAMNMFVLLSPPLDDNASDVYIIITLLIPVVFFFVIFGLLGQQARKLLIEHSQQHQGKTLLVNRVSVFFFPVLTVLWVLNKPRYCQTLS